MRPLDRSRLSAHEVKRCRAIAHGQYWEVWEENLLWWSPDEQRWQPVQDDVLPRRRRWLVLETEEGYATGLIWEAGDDFSLPAATPRAPRAPARQPAYGSLRLDT
jgi:hypothetical protein